MEEPLTPREFLHRYSLPQLVRIHEAHRVSLDSSSICSTINRTEMDSMETSLGSSASTSSTSTMTSESMDRSDGGGDGVGLGRRQMQGQRMVCERNNNNNVANNKNDHNNHFHRMTISGTVNMGKMLTASSTSSINKVKCSGLTTVNSEEERRTPIDLDQPFLLYKAYTSRQVIAYTLSPEANFDSGYFKQIGPTLLIPEGYQGWFSLVNSKGHTAGYFNTIDEVGRAQVPYFLTRDPIRGYKAPRFAVLAETPNRVTSLISVKGDSGYEPVTIDGGTVLRFVGVYEDISAFILGPSKAKNSIRFKKNMPSPMDHGPRYAKCVKFGELPGGEILFVPITETGRFYVMAKRSNELSYNHVYSFAQLLRLVKLPVTVQLITGPRPRNYPNFPDIDPSKPSDHLFEAKPNVNFSAVLRLEEIRVRDVILGCTLTPQTTTITATSDRFSAISSIRRTWRGSRPTIKMEEKPTLLEFDLDSGFSFFRTFVERNGTISSRKIPELVIQRIGFCDSEAESWRRQIKLAHEVVTKEMTIPATEKVAKTLPMSTSTGNIPIYRKTRKSLFESGVVNIPTDIDKTASIGSRGSSANSSGSRLSKIISRFWHPLQRRSTIGPNRKCDLIGESIETIGEIEVIKEEEQRVELERPVKKQPPAKPKRGVTSGSSIIKKKNCQPIPEYHYYETLKKGDEIKYFPPKQKLSRKQTLDVIFNELDSDNKICRNGIVQRSPSPDDEPAYSTIE